MPFEINSSLAPPTASRPKADFSQRADPEQLSELLDEPCDFETLRGCLRDLSVINRLTLSYRPILNFLAHVAVLRPPRPIRIVDVGCGFGDTLRRIHRWAALRRLPVDLTGIDLNPHATRAAREASADLPPDAITWITGDALRAELPHPPDLILSSLLTHHLTDTQVVRFVRWMEANAQLGWFINDLERQPTPARLFVLLVRTLRMHPFLKHDGPVSFRRAFRRADWHALLAEAEIPPHAARIRSTFPARLCVSRLK